MPRMEPKRDDDTSEMDPSHVLIKETARGSGRGAYDVGR